ncbi:hypothetical protein A3Q56_02835 [Intoshia linei]|uniref:GP-PDE domain-containing protein n=1 Tax=Intoshia linei TaxID=1819745 RepID=A0A177B6X8_9BILA|nr:hypothetical protein A3Q56_02835 [Intoshia linei]
MDLITIFSNMLIFNVTLWFLVVFAIVLFKIFVGYFGIPRPNEDHYVKMRNYIRHAKKIGHRGYMDNAPENTLESIEFIASLPEKAIEIDIASTRDGHLVIFVFI